LRGDLESFSQEHTVNQKKTETNNRLDEDALESKRFAELHNKTKN